MRLSQEQIKQALVHPDSHAREAALRHFCERLTADESIMPLVIQAVDKYGQQNAFPMQLTGDDLPQTDATLGWLIRELDRSSVLHVDDDWLRSWQMNLCRHIVGSPPALLEPRLDELARLPGFEAGYLDDARERVRLSRLDVAAVWSELVATCEDQKAAFYINEFDFRPGNRCVEAIARDGSSLTAEILRMVAARIEEFDENPQVWLESFAIRLAGRMRLIEAIPLLLAKLVDGTGEDGGDLLTDDCVTALKRIGTDELIDQLGRGFLERSRSFRLFAIELFGHVDSDLARKQSIALMRDEPDDTNRTNLAIAALLNFDTEVTHAVYQEITRGRFDASFAEVDDDLVGVSALLGLEFPELVEWRRQADFRIREFWEKVPIARGILENDDWSEFDHLESAFDDDFDDDDLEDEPTRSITFGTPRIPELAQASQVPALAETFTHATPHVGRNDPCPCGSGKKFKKCCLKRNSGAG